MPPKKRTVKKGKNTLTRGRPTKQPKDEATTTTTATSETDDNASERHASPDRGAVQPLNKKPPKVMTSSKNVSKESDEDKGLEKEETWEDLPNLIDELMVKGGGDCGITYVTNTREHRAFELDARKELLQMNFELESLKNTLDTSLRVMRNLCPDVKKGKVSEVVRSLGCPSTFKELVVKLVNLPSPTAQVPRINIVEPIFEESETEVEEDTVGVGIPYTGTVSSKKFPSPAKMAKYQTPRHQGPSSNGIFQFGAHTSKGLSTNKAARLPKPGEVVYSEGGSPILQRRIQDGQQTLERVEILQPDGSKYEVDIVYRGAAKDADKLRGFKEFAKDVRGIAASRATSVRQNRVQPPKIKVGSQSASKGRKPEWR